MAGRYGKCIHKKENKCFCPAMRNGMNSLDCIGYDRCDEYSVGKKISRIDVIAQNGNDGEHYEEVD